MAKEKEWKLALRARSGSQGEDWEGLKGVGAGEGLGKGWAPAKDWESFKILGKETSWTGV